MQDFANDFLRDFSGSKYKIVDILIHISWFIDLCLGMTLKTDKTYVFVIMRKTFFFLRYKICKKYGLIAEWKTIKT